MNQVNRPPPPSWTDLEIVYTDIAHDTPLEKTFSAPTKETAHTNIEGSVCEQCRKSKVKCSRGNPCARCVRLGLTCTPTPPSRRGRKRTKTMETCEGMVLDSIERSLKKEEREKGKDDTKVSEEKESNENNGKSQPGVGIQFLLRTWIFNCFRRRSTFLLLKAARLAMQYNVALDDIIGEKDGPMAILPSLIFSKTQNDLKIDDLIGKRLKIEDLQKSHVDSLRKHTGSIDDQSFYMFGRHVNKGYMRYFFSPDFERDFKTEEEEPDFCMRQPCWRPIFSTHNSHDKIMKAIAEAYVV